MSQPEGLLQRFVQMIGAIPLGPFGPLVRLIRGVADQFVRDGCLNTAAALTYTSLFAVVPFMTVGYAVFSVLPAFADVGTQIEDFVFSNFVPASGEVVQSQLQNFSEQARDLTWPGLVFLAITAYFTLTNIERAFNRIWRVHRPRTGFSRLLVYWTMLTMGPPLVAVGVLVSSYLLSLQLVSRVDAFGLRELFLTFLPSLCSAAVFVVLFYAMPNTRVRLLHAFVGGLCTMLMFQLAFSLFKLAVANSTVQVVYGTFAAVPLFLSWLYLAWTLVLGGAVLVRQLGMPPTDRLAESVPLEMALRILQRLRQAHQQGRSLQHDEIVALAPNVDGQYWSDLLAQLADTGLVNVLDDGEYRLGRDLRMVSLYELYQLLPHHSDELSLPELPDIANAFAQFHAAASETLGSSVDELMASVKVPADAQYSISETPLSMQGAR